MAKMTHKSPLGISTEPKTATCEKYMESTLEKIGPKVNSTTNGLNCYQNTDQPNYSRPKELDPVHWS
jgi:hypothetical protein